MTTTARWVLLAVVVLFVVFVIVKSRLATALSPELAAARRKIAALRRQAREAESNQERARLWREAAIVALEEADRPSLAASLARRAERADPDHEDSVALLVRTLRERRPRALAKILWRRLDQEGIASPHAEAMMRELIALYEGPMRNPAKARVIRAFWSERGGA